MKEVWLDCDPGHDDMLAILLAAYHPNLRLIGLSTSAGNSTIDYTTQNALNILSLISRDDVVVVKGAAKPLYGKLETAAETHGVNGLEGASLPISSNHPICKQPYVTMYNRIMEREGKVYFVNTGAMTNLALLLTAFP